MEKKKLLVPESVDDNVRKLYHYNNIFLFPPLQCLNWRYNHQYELYSHQEWAIALKDLSNKAIDQARKVRKLDDDSDDRLKVLEETLKDHESAINALVEALRESDEKLGRAEGMLRFCYAICQNPGIKDLADRNKASAASSLRPLGMRFNPGARDYDAGGNAKPRPGLGGAGLP